MDFLEATHWRGLCTELGESNCDSCHLFLTLALSVATGESAMLICQAVCDRGVEADADACQHAQSAAPVSMSDDGDCLGLGLPATATLRVELDRPDSHGATPVAVSNESVIDDGRTPLRIDRFFSPCRRPASHCRAQDLIPFPSVLDPTFS